MKTTKIRDKNNRVVAMLVYEKNGETIHLYYNKYKVVKPKLLLSEFKFED